MTCVKSPCDGRDLTQSREGLPVRALRSCSRRRVAAVTAPESARFPAARHRSERPAAARTATCLGVSRPLRHAVDCSGLPRTSWASCRASLPIQRRAFRAGSSSWRRSGGAGRAVCAPRLRGGSGRRQGEARGDPVARTRPGDERRTRRGASVRACGDGPRACGAGARRRGARVDDRVDRRRRVDRVACQVGARARRPGDRPSAPARRARRREPLQHLGPDRPVERAEHGSAGAILAQQHPGARRDASTSTIARCAARTSSPGSTSACPSCRRCPTKSDINVEPKLKGTVNGTPFGLAGRATPFAAERRAVLDIDIDELPVAQYVEYLPVRLRVEVKRRQAFHAPQAALRAAGRGRRRAVARRRRDPRGAGRAPAGRCAARVAARIKVSIERFDVAARELSSIRGRRGAGADRAPPGQTAPSSSSATSSSGRRAAPTCARRDAVEDRRSPTVERCERERDDHRRQRRPAVPRGHRQLHRSRILALERRRARRARSSSRSTSTTARAAS